MEEVNKKIRNYAKLENDLQLCITQKDNYVKTARFLEKKLSDKAQ